MNALGILRSHRGMIQQVFFICCNGCGREQWSFAKYKRAAGYDLEREGWGTFSEIWFCPRCLKIAKESDQNEGVVGNIDEGYFVIFGERQYGAFESYEEADNAFDEMLKERYLDTSVDA